MSAGNPWLLIGCSLVGVALREVWAISRRSKDKKFSITYYLKQNEWVILWNLLGVVALLLCKDIIFLGESKLVSPEYMPLLVAPTGIAIGFGGGYLVRKLLNKGASKAGLADVFDQVETSVEVTPDAVKTTTTATTITTQPVTPPTPPTDVGV